MTEKKLSRPNTDFTMSARVKSRSFVEERPSSSSSSSAGAGDVAADDDDVSAAEEERTLEEEVAVGASAAAATAKYQRPTRPVACASTASCGASASPPNGFAIRRFDPRKIRPYSTVLFAGGRRTGKSTVMRDVMYRLRKRFYEMVVYTGTNEQDHPWSSMTPQKNVKMCLAEFPGDDLEERLNVQRERIKICDGVKVTCPPTLLAFEDLEFLKDPIWNNQSVRSVWFNGRWSATYAFCAFQYIMEIKMALRNMFDYAFFMMDPSVKSRERIYQQYCGIIPTREMFESIFKMCTTDYRAMVVDLRSRSYNLEDSIYWYKADPLLPPFRIGVDDVWDRSVDEENVVRRRRARDSAREKAKKASRTTCATAAPSRSRRSGATSESVTVTLQDYAED